MVTVGKRARNGMLVAAILGSLFRTAPARGADSTPPPQPLHFRPIVLADYFVLSKAPPDTPSHAGGMMLTLPLGVELDNPWLHWDDGSGRSITVGTLGVYGPGLNWVGLADKRPWYPLVVGAVKLSVVQFGFRTRSPKPTTDPNPPELQVGVGLLTVLTGEVFNASDDRGSGLSAGWSVNFSFTPDAL